MARLHIVMQSYPARALGRRLQVDWARDPREGPRVLMSLRVDFEPMGYYFYFKAHENLNPRENSSKVNKSL